jgi:hypothetical protein
MLVDAYGWNTAIWLYGISAVIGCALQHDVEPNPP